MSKRFILPILIVLLVPICLRAQPAESGMREKEEYAVYSAIIPEIYHRDEGGILVVANPTSRCGHRIAMKNFELMYGAPDVSHETLDDFSQRDQTDRWLTRKLQLDFDYVIANYSQVKKLIGEPLSDWGNFFKQFPASDGFISYSRVGFNERMDQALVYGGWRCRGLCGHLEFLLLEKKEGVWKVVNRANEEVS